MKRLIMLLFLAIAILFELGSCAKKASNMVVGHWEVETIVNCSSSYSESDYYGLFKQGAIWEFDADGTIRFVINNEVYKGSLYWGPCSYSSEFEMSSFEGPDVQMSSFLNQLQLYGCIWDMEDNWMLMDLSMYYPDVHLRICFIRTNKSVLDNQGNRFPEPPSPEVPATPTSSLMN